MTDAEWIERLEALAERMRRYSRENGKRAKSALDPTSRAVAAFNAEADTWVGAAGLVQELIHEAKR